MYTNETAANLYKDAIVVKYPDQVEPSSCDNDCRRMLFCAATSNDEDAARVCNDNDKLQILPYDWIGRIPDMAKVAEIPMGIDNIFKHGWFEKIKK